MFLYIWRGNKGEALKFFYKLFFICWHMPLDGKPPNAAQVGSTEILIFQYFMLTQNPISETQRLE